MRFIHRAIAFMGLLLPGVTFAAVSSAVSTALHHSPAGVGGAAQSLLEPITLLSNSIGILSMVIGASFILGSLLKYTQHRVNPLAVPMSTVVVLLIMGITLILLPLVYKVTGTGIPLQIPGSK